MNALNINFFIKTNYQKLQKDLSFFGLSPNDWSIIKISKNTFQIQNKESRDFIFTGTTNKKNQNIEWQSITLTSL